MAVPLRHHLLYHIAMSIMNALASVAVRDMNTAVPWYEALFERAASRPMAEVAEWSFPRGGWLQVYLLPEMAGTGSLTLAVSDLNAQIVHLERLGIALGPRTSSSRVKTLMITDLDGNHIAFAETSDASLAH